MQNLTIWQNFVEFFPSSTEKGIILPSQRNTYMEEYSPLVKILLIIRSMKSFQGYIYFQESINFSPMDFYRTKKLFPSILFKRNRILRRVKLFSVLSVINCLECEYQLFPHPHFPLQTKKLFAVLPQNFSWEEF